MRQIYLKKLRLYNYRNFVQKEFLLSESGISKSGIIVIYGNNGAGKTNLLEAISQLSPGTGLRKARLENLICNDNVQTNLVSGEGGVMNKYMLGDAKTVISYDFEIYYGNQDKVEASNNICNDNVKISCAIVGKDAGSEIERGYKYSKNIIIDGKKQSSQQSLASLMNVIWLTPQMDHMFIATPSVRRQFFDRLVYNFVKEHASNISNYEKLQRERLKILLQMAPEQIDSKDMGSGENAGKGNFDSWLQAVEMKMAAYAYEIIYARHKIADDINNMMSRLDNAFPKALLRIDDITTDLGYGVGDLLNLEIRAGFCAQYQQRLYDIRKKEHQIGRSLFGVNKSDLVVYFIDPSKENMVDSNFNHSNLEKLPKAANSSTGQQKSLLISIILAAALLLREVSELPMILLLDELAAHLDEYKRRALYDILLDLECQCFLTGTELEIFEELVGKADFIDMGLK